MSRAVRWSIVIGIGLAVILLYGSTLQTIPNGSDNYYMIDVGETQIVLNVWGTLHATGYPLYVMSGNVLVTLLKALSANPALAPALVSLLWGAAALVLIYALAFHLTGRAILSALVTALFGLTRTVWIHNAIAEIYTFGLMILALLLLLALYRGEIRHRIYWLALIGGIGVAHHRAIIMVAPALLYAVWPHLIADRRRLPRVIVISLLLGLVGLLQYAYLPLRANAGASWVYGDPDTLAGLWDQFIGREAARFIGPPSSLIDNFNMVNQVLITDLTLPGLLIGLIGLGLALLTPRYRRPAITLLISGVTAYVFHVVLYGDILSALILPITLSIAFGWLFLGDWLLVRATRPGSRAIEWRTSLPSLVLPGIALLAGGLIAQNQPFIRMLTQDETGLQTIQLARGAPSGSTLMIPWGTRHFAVGFARDVLGELPDITLVDHKADFAAILEQGTLVTPDYTFYTEPLSWWEEQLGKPVYLNAAAPGLVQIETQASYADGALPEGISVYYEDLACNVDQIIIAVSWVSAEKPSMDLSVFVHLLDDDGNVVAQADQSAPVYGWRPLTTWEGGEIVRDVYALPRLPGADRIRYGLYHQLDNGEFRNEYTFEVAVNCQNES